jgi:23S rRNA (guanosine2251-2'-O)-methyltransferase
MEHNKNRKPYQNNKKDNVRQAPRRPQNEAKPAPSEEEGIHGTYENGAIIGRNAVRELLRSNRDVDKLLVQKGERNGSIVVLVAQALERKIPVIETEKSKLDALAGYAPHQGVIAFAAEKEYCSVEELLEIAKERGEAPLLVICDGVTDPYNLGAIIRCAECCGAHGLIIPKRRAVGLTPLVTKASAGAIEHLAVAKVSNIATTVEALKEQGVWVYAAEAGGASLYDTDFTGPCAIVMGSEGNGVSQLVRKLCDGTVSIPMYGKVNSFNVSTAAAILLAEVARQHHKND